MSEQIFAHGAVHDYRPIDLGTYRESLLEVGERFRIDPSVILRLNPYYREESPSALIRLPLPADGPFVASEYEWIERTPCQGRPFRVEDACEVNRRDPRSHGMDQQITPQELWLHPVNAGVRAATILAKLRGRVVNRSQASLQLASVRGEAQEWIRAMDVDPASVALAASIWTPVKKRIRSHCVAISTSLTGAARTQAVELIPDWLVDIVDNHILRVGSLARRIERDNATLRETIDDANKACASLLVAHRLMKIEHKIARVEAPQNAGLLGRWKDDIGHALDIAKDEVMGTGVTVGHATLLRCRDQAGRELMRLLTADNASWASRPLDSTLVELPELETEDVRGPHTVADWIVTVQARAARALNELKVVETALRNWGRRALDACYGEGGRPSSLIERVLADWRSTSRIDQVATATGSAASFTAAAVGNLAGPPSLCVALAEINLEPSLNEIMTRLSTESATAQPSTAQPSTIETYGTTPARAPDPGWRSEFRALWRAWRLRRLILDCMGDAYAAKLNELAELKLRGRLTAGETARMNELHDDLQANVHNGPFFNGLMSAVNTLALVAEAWSTYSEARDSSWAAALARHGAALNVAGANAAVGFATLFKLLKDESAELLNGPLGFVGVAMSVQTLAVTEMAGDDTTDAEIQFFASVLTTVPAGPARTIGITIQVAYGLQSLIQTLSFMACPNVQKVVVALCTAFAGSDHVKALRLVGRHRALDGVKDVVAAMAGDCYNINVTNWPSAWWALATSFRHPERLHTFWERFVAGPIDYHGASHFSPLRAPHRIVLEREQVPEVIRNAVMEDGQGPGQQPAAASPPRIPMRAALTAR